MSNHTSQLTKNPFLAQIAGQLTMHFSLSRNSVLPSILSHPNLILPLLASSLDTEEKRKEKQSTLLLLPKLASLSSDIQILPNSIPNVIPMDWQFFPIRWLSESKSVRTAPSNQGRHLPSSSKKLEPSASITDADENLYKP